MRNNYGLYTISIYGENDTSWVEQFKKSGIIKQLQEKRFPLSKPINIQFFDTDANVYIEFNNLHINVNDDSSYTIETSVITGSVGDGELLDTHLAIVIGFGDGEVNDVSVYYEKSSFAVTEP